MESSWLLTKHLCDLKKSHLLILGLHFLVCTINKLNEMLPKVPSSCKFHVSEEANLVCISETIIAFHRDMPSVLDVSIFPKSYYPAKGLGGR